MNQVNNVVPAQFPDLLIYDIPLPDGPSPCYLVCLPRCFKVIRVWKGSA